MACKTEAWKASIGLRGDETTRSPSEGETTNNESHRLKESTINHRGGGGGRGGGRGGGGEGFLPVQHDIQRPFRRTQKQLIFSSLEKVGYFF